MDGREWKTKRRKQEETKEEVGKEETGKNIEKEDWRRRRKRRG